MKKAIWIDITNSPHVLFFKPLIKALDEREIPVIVTAREYAQTVPLLKKSGIQFELIGKHQGKSAFRKAFGFLKRALSLASFVRGKNVAVSLSHQSHDLALASKILGIPNLLITDYEYLGWGHRINSRLVSKVLIPEAIPKESLVKCGYRKDTIEQYPGIKEDVYLPFFQPDPEILSSLGVREDKILVVMRPPATMALYHRFENELFHEILRWLSHREDVQVVVIPRTREQKEELEKVLPDNASIPSQVVDGPSLLYFADLLIGAGGTMNREAAALGTPVYTIFKGNLGAVDRYLIAEGRMKRVEKLEDIEVKKKKRRKEMRIGRETFDFVLREILEFYEAVK